MVNSDVLILGTYEDFGRWVRNSRQEQGYTQRDFAAKINCTVEHLSKIEHGHRMPSRLLTELIVNTLKYDLVVAVRPQR